MRRIGRSGIYVLDQYRESFKQVMKSGQRSSSDLTTLPFCFLQRNQSPPLPAPERKDPPQPVIGPLAHHHEFPSLIVFKNESLYVHIVSSPVLSGITVDNSSRRFFIRTETDTTTFGSCIIHPLHHRQEACAVATRISPRLLFSRLMSNGCFGPGTQHARSSDPGLKIRKRRRKNNRLRRRYC